MATGRKANALEFLVDRVRQREAQMAFVSITVAMLGHGYSDGDGDSVRASASEILGVRAAACDVRKLLARHALNRPRPDRDSL